MREDSSNNFYVQRPDGSRLYLTGPFKNLQVWADGSDSLYIKIANGGRQYLTEPYERLYAYEDSTGKWFVINNQGRKVFIENWNLKIRLVYLRIRQLYWFLSIFLSIL